MKSYKELITKLDESTPKEGTVKTAKYSWGTMKTVHHGKDFSIPLHPEHHQAISKLKDEQEHKFKDETGRHWVARRKGEHVHFDTTGNGSMKTHVPMHTMHESVENLQEEDHAELARKAAAEYRKALSRGDSVAANAANAEHIRHKRAAMVLRKKSHTPGEIEEGYDSPLDTPEQKKAREDLKKTLLDIKKKNPKHPAVQDVKEELQLDEGKMGQIAADIEDHLGKHLDTYKKQGGAEHFGSKVLKTHAHIAKLHGIEQKHAAKLVNDYVDSKLKEEVELSEEHLVHVSDGSKYGEQPHDKDVEHVMSGVKKHGGEFDGHSDKGAYFKFKSHSDAQSFKRHVDSCPKRTCHADLHESLQEAVQDLDKYFAGIEMKGGEPKKSVVKKESEPEIKGSQLKFFNTFKEELELSEKMNLAKAKMGDVVKDFQKSDAPQFAGKSKEKRQEMAVAAKLQADRQQNEGVIQNTGTDALEIGADKAKDTVVRDKKGKLISFKHEGEWKKSTGTITDKGGAKHGPMSQARHLARSAMKAVKEDVVETEELLEDKHIVHVTVSDPNHTMVSKRKETIQKRAVVSAKDKHGAISAAISHYKKQGYKVHDDHYVGLKEEAELDEAFVNGREYASHGLMHPNHVDYHKAGSTVDFYAHGTGDKISGKVTKNTGKEVHIQADKNSGGKLHKFTVSSNLPKQQNEAYDSPLDTPEATKARQDLKKTLLDIKKKNPKHPAVQDVKEDLDILDEAVESGNKGFGYHGQHGSDVADKKYSATHSTVKRVAGQAGHLKDAKKPNVMVKHYLDSRHGRHLAGLEHDHEYIKKDFGKFKKSYKESDYMKEGFGVDAEGDYVIQPISYKDFAMMIEGKAQYVVKAIHNQTGRVKVTNYVADKDESQHGVHARAEREHKPMGYSIDSIRRKDIEAHDEGEEGSTDSTQKRGRGRPAGSKSGARGPRIK